MLNDTLSTIQNIILNKASKKSVPIEEIILFGSRARGDYTQESDWDILIVTTAPLKKHLFWDLYVEIKRELTKNKIPADIIIIPKSTFEKKKRIVGNIAYYASREGRILWKRSAKRLKDAKEAVMIAEKVKEEVIKKLKLPQE